MSCARVVLQTCLGPSLGFQGPFNPLSVTALDYTLHLSNAMEDLQGLRQPKESTVTAPAVQILVFSFEARILQLFSIRQVLERLQIERH